MAGYIYEREDWPGFSWRQEELAAPLAALHLRRGQLLGRMASVGFPQSDEVLLKTLTQDVVKSSEIEGEILNSDQVRSSIAKRLGMDAAGLPKADRRVDGVV